MRRIYSYNLAILFYFLQGKTWSIPITNRVRKEALASLFDNLESIVATQDVFCREIQNDSYIVSVEEPQKHILKDYLEKYCTELVNDRLETRNQNVLRWNFARQEFIKRLAPLNLNCFISTNIYDMPQLAPELIKLDDNGGYTLEISIDTVRERISEESFSFKCSLNLSGIVKEQEKTKTVKSASQRQDKTSNKYHFTESQRYLLGLILERIETGNDSVITLDDLERIYSPKKDDSKLKTSLDTRMSNNVSKLNTIFKKVTGKKVLERQEPYNVQVDEMNLNYNGLDYDIIATLEDINIALKLSSNTLE